MKLEIKRPIQPRTTLPPGNTQCFSVFPGRGAILGARRRWGEAGSGLAIDLGDSLIWGGVKPGRRRKLKTGGKMRWNMGQGENWAAGRNARLDISCPPRFHYHPTPDFSPSQISPHP